MTSCSLGYEASSEKFLYYILSDQVWWCSIKRFFSYSKNCICKFMLANSWHDKLFHFHLSFFIWKVWKRREKITKVWISWERKELFRWNKKTLFIVFEGLSFGELDQNGLSIAIFCNIFDFDFWSLGEFNPSSANPTSWSDALKQFVGNSQRIVWVCLTILWGWHLKV